MVKNTGEYNEDCLSNYENKGRKKTLEMLSLINLN